MAHKPMVAAASTRVTINYQLIRNTTSPDEKSVNVQSFVANLPAHEILKIGTRSNLRSYLAEYNPRKRNRVHDAIRTTLNDTPERFIIRNSGFVVTCSSISVDDNKKTATLKDPSIINGAQSQGEIEAFLEELDWDEADPPFHVRAYIIVDEDPDEIVETAIARNIVTPVKSISEAGARNQLDELEKSISSVIKGAKIRKNESQSGDDYLDTRFLLQITRLLMPSKVSGSESPSETLRAYKNPEQCLTDFCDWELGREKDLEKAERYQFSIDIAPHAYRLYKKWEAHPAWTGQRIFAETKKGGRAAKRDKKSGKVIWISPGIIFPIMGAMSVFCSKKNGRWQIEIPDRFREEEMIQRAANQFRAADSDPMRMGRYAGAYDALKIYPQTLVEVLREFEKK